MRLMLRSEPDYATLGTSNPSAIPTRTELGPCQRNPDDKRGALVMVRQIIVIAPALAVTW